MKPYLFATSGDDVRIWDAITLELRHHFWASKSSRAPSVRWSHDGQQMLAVPKSGESVYLTRICGPTLTHMTVPIKQGVTSATYDSETARFLGIGCKNGDVLIWNLNNNKPRGIFQAPHQEAVTSVCFGARDSILASGGADGKLVLNNVVVMSSFRQLAAIPGTIVRQVLFSPLRRYLLSSASSQGRVDVWDAASQKHRHCFSGLHEDCTGIALSHVNDSFLLSVGDEGTIGMYDLDSKSIHRSIKAREGLHSVGFLHDGIHFVVGGVSGHAFVYDLRQSTEPVVGTILAHAGPVTSVCMQPLTRDEETGLSVEQQRANFTLCPKETHAPMSLTLMNHEDVVDVFSPANSVVRESSSSGRPSNSSEGLSQLSAEGAKQTYSPFSPLGAVQSNRLDDSFSSILSFAGNQTAKSKQLFSSPRDNLSVSAVEAVEEAPLSPIDSDCESSCGDKEAAPKYSEGLHDENNVSMLWFDKSSEAGDTAAEKIICSVKDENAASSCSQDSRNDDPPTSGSDDAEGTREQSMIQKLRCLYGLADDDSILKAGNLAQIVRRVVRQELSDLRLTLRAQQEAALNEVMGELRSLRQELQELKEF